MSLSATNSSSNDMSSSAATGLVPLTDKQEQRLSFWLDEQLLQLTRGYEGRHGEKSTMPTITHFLKAVRRSRIELVSDG